MKSRLGLLIITVTLLFAGCASTAQRGAMLRANSAVKDGRFDDALARLSSAEKYETPTPALQAEITFLRATSYEGLKRLPDAIGSYKYLIATFPTSPYAYQARERLDQLERK